MRAINEILDDAYATRHYRLQHRARTLRTANGYKKDLEKMYDEVRIDRIGPGKYLVETAGRRKKVPQ